MDYKSTLNLPMTSFAMKAGLAEQEPKRLEKWSSNDLYHKILEGRDKSKRYVLHDGPPYANGNIHIGTALNKILKDIVVKVKAGQGFYSPYIPGWDCHGLPIEHKVGKELGDKKATMSTNEIRKICREYAAHWLDVQRTSFKRLGVIGDWDNPYITMDYHYEMITLREFYSVYKKGDVYKGSKPVYWCSDCGTALAEAEVEYHDHTSPSIFVKFALTDSALQKIGVQEAVNAVIWTTTPWTLPANMAISANPNEKYSVMRIDALADDSMGNIKKGELLLLAQPLVQSLDATLKSKLKIAEWTEVKTIDGVDLELLETKHPFYDRMSPIILGEHVLMSDGTGLVHTAPAHGMDDYIVGNKYNIEVFNPVDDYGKFKKDLPIFGGMDIRKGNKDIVNYIKENGALIENYSLVHSYPHCWRCKQPVIHRATPQWFISMEQNGLREKALNAIRNEVRWIPSWGSNRIGSMVETRPDWCISRQRTWGVPIALFTCRDCEKVIFDETIEQKVLSSFEKMGADAWFEHDVAYYLGDNAKCPHCGSHDIKKETDILDVWFDSGTSHAAVCEDRAEIAGMADMYLEGSDQHRGWFQSSLLESVATRGRAPYKEVLTHGFIIDTNRVKMSKSIGNVISPEVLVEKYGAEILRLWVSSEDYSVDISISDEIMKRQVESYRKIRNTLRYMLGNIYDFHPDTDTVKFDQLMELDKYILLRWQDVLNKVYAGFDGYQFHIFYHQFLNFCINDLSALYLDIIKDRLYSYAPASKERRSAQTVLFALVKEMATIMAPVLSFTADEVWESLPDWSGKKMFVFEELFPSADRFSDDKTFAKVEELVELRKVVNKALELSRAEKIIGHPLDAKVTVISKKADWSIDEGIARFMIVSEFEAIAGDGEIEVKVAPSEAEKCARCWTKDASVGKNSKHADLCERCATVLDGLE